MVKIRPGHIRRVWLVAGSLLAVAVLCFSALQTVSVLAHEEETFDTVVDDPISVVDIDNSAGSIEVVAADDDRLTVTAHISDGLAATHHSEEIDGNELVVRASCPWLSTWCDADYVIAAPADVAVIARSSGGSITVDGIEGDLDLATNRGGITVREPAGALTLDNDHGSIDVRGATSDVVDASSDHGTVELEFADPPRSVTADTDHGDVRIRVPDDETEYDLDVSAGHGGSTNLAVRADPDGENTITAHSDHGNVSVTYPGG